MSFRIGTFLASFTILPNVFPHGPEIHPHLAPNRYHVRSIIKDNKWVRLPVYITGMVNQRLLLVPFENTWSCYTAGQTHCGRCGTCVERIEAFQIARVHDPTEYVLAVAKDA